MRISDWSSDVCSSDLADFLAEYAYELKHFVGRPSPVYHARRWSERLGGAQIWFKREDLNHTGAHKVNNCIGQILLARRMGKPRIIAETGARSEEHTSELQSLMRISYAVFCLKKKK